MLCQRWRKIWGTAREVHRRLSTWQRGGGYLPGPSGEMVLYTVIGVNVGVFVSWNVLDPYFMTKHFTLSLPNLQAGRYHTIITHAFSHMDILHLGTNMIVLYFSGRALSRVLLGKQLMNLYVTGALASAATDMAWKLTSDRRRVDDRGWSSIDMRDWFRQRRIRDAPSLGASGAVNSMVILFCCLFPKEIIYVNFIIPVPAFLLGVLFILHDFTSLKSEDNVSHAGHLGGVAVGLMYFLKLRYLR